MGECERVIVGSVPYQLMGSLCSKGDGVAAMMGKQVLPPPKGTLAQDLKI
jgi:hypothetical protein